MSQSKQQVLADAKVKYVFIIGSKRSGTTWMMWLLAQHPAAVGFFHSGFFKNLQRLEIWWQANPPYGKSIVIANSKDQGGKSSHDGNYSQVHINDLLSIGELYDYCRALSTNIIDKVVRCKPDAEVFLETNPENLERLEFILGVFPDAYILHVIRDPRSVFSSWRCAASTWSDSVAFTKSPIEFAKRWRLDVTTAIQARNMTSRYKEIHYEKLLDDGSNQLGDIFRWLDLPADKSFCQRAVEACKIEKLREHSLTELQGFYRKGTAQGWREEISSSDVRVIESIAGNMMVEFGYERSFSRSESKPARLRLHELSARFFRWVIGGSSGKHLVKLVNKIRRMAN